MTAVNPNPAPAHGACLVKGEANSPLGRDRSSLSHKGGKGFSLQLDAASLQG